MHATNSEIAAFAVYLTGMALCMWRAPQSDRWHALLCGIAAALWAGIWIFNPPIRTPTFLASVATWLAIAAFGARQRRKAVGSS